MATYLNKSGNLYLKRNGKFKLIKPNTKFEAEPYEISENFMDTIQLLKETPKVEKIVDEVVDEVVEGTVEEKVKSYNEPAYKIVNTTTGWWDVVANYPDGTSKVLNAKKLRKAKAEERLESLLS